MVPDSPDVEQVLACTDGVSRLVDYFGYSWPQVVDLATRGAPRDLLRAVRAAEASGPPPGVRKKHDDATGFTAMERLTGFSTATYAKHLADGGCEPGCHRYETAMTGQKFVDEIQKRGIVLKFAEENL